MEVRRYLNVLHVTVGALKYFKSYLMNVSVFRQKQSFSRIRCCQGQQELIFRSKSPLFPAPYLIGRFRCPSDYLSSCDWLLHMSIRNNQILLAESHGRDARDQRWLMRVQATSGFSDFEYFCFFKDHIIKINKCI